MWNEQVTELICDQLPRVLEKIVLEDLLCLTSLVVDVGPQDVSTGQMLESKTFGDPARHCSFPRSRWSHNNSSEHSLQDHLYFFKVRISI